MVTDVVTNSYRGIAELLSIGFCARNTDSNPRCLIKNASLKEAFFNVRHRRNRTPDNGVDRGVDRGKYVGIICIWIRIFCGYNINTGKVWYQKN